MDRLLSGFTFQKARQGTGAATTDAGAGRVVNFALENLASSVNRKRAGVTWILTEAPCIAVNAVGVSTAAQRPRVGAVENYDHDRRHGPTRQVI